MIAKLIINNEINDALTEEIIHELAKDNDLKPKINITRKKIDYFPSSTINISTTSLNDFLESNISDIAPTYNIKDLEALRKCLYLFVLVHEYTHFEQYSFTTYDNDLKELYTPIFKLFKNSNDSINLIMRITKLIRFRKYKQSKNLLLERNANYKGAKIVLEYMRNIDSNITAFLEDFEISNLKHGYSYENKEILFPAKKTYDNLWLNYDFPFTKNFTLNQRLEHGLEIDSDSYFKIFSKYMLAQKN
jgi:hypothetical protein